MAHDQSSIAAVYAKDTEGFPSVWATALAAQDNVFVVSTPIALAPEYVIFDMVTVGFALIATGCA